MGGSFNTGQLVWRSRITQVFAFGLIAAGSLNPALGQLRSGRTQRSLYQDSANARSGVEPASYAPTRETSSNRPMSILESEQGFDSGGGRVVQAACSDCDAGVVSSGGGCSSCDGGMSMLDTGCGAAGCDSFGCDTCSGGYSSIAPTCSATCPPGCGPLVALWYRLKVRAEVPLFWRRGQGAPPLVTTSPVGTAIGIAGELGQNTTETLLGGSVLSNDGTAGIRFTASTWLGQGEEYGLMLRVWDAGDLDESYGFNSSSNAILARPFFDTTITGAAIQETQLISFPGESSGSINVNTESSVSGVEISLKRLLYKDRFTRIDWLYGFQHISIDEALGISSNTTVTSGLLSGSQIAVSDRFATENDFNGVSYGLMSTRQVACWRMETMFRLGAGNLRRQVNIAGSTTTSAGGVSVTDNQGLLARNTNNQTYVDDTFVLVPELGINFAYRFRPGLDFNIGYNYMLLPKVAQAGQQIDDSLAVNLSDPLLGSLDPALNFDEREFWLHSLGLGLQMRY